MTRLPDTDLRYFEDVIALTLMSQSRIRRLIYIVDDPDALADLSGIAAESAAIRQKTIAERDRRRLQIKPR